MADFEIKNLCFAYSSAKEKPALLHVDLKIEQGEYIALCGKSGSGKSTLLKHLKSVLTPFGVRSGAVLFDGRHLDEVDHREQSARIGFVMQNPDSQIVTDKVWHELAFGLESLGYDQATIRLRVAEMASYFGIQGWFHKDVKDLSGGQKQLLNLASIMAMQPDVLILDEPTSQLDPIAAADFLNTVRKINLELRTTVIITEHRLEDVLYAADRVVVMEGGRVVCQGLPREIGNELKRQGSDMFAAMPTPMRVFYGVGEDLDKPCPLTVREGGDWLSGVFKDEKPKIIHIDEERNELLLPENVEAKDCAVYVQEAWFRYTKEGQDVLRGVELKVPKGSFYAIVGGNGTGKSTTLKAICNICRVYRGKISVLGTAIDKYKSGELFKNNLAMLPQDPQSLFVKKTVKGELDEMSKDEALKEKITDLCEIRELLGRHPYDLSGGEQQRAALAKVLLTEPKVLLLDEPTKGIDAFFKQKLASILKELKKQGMTIVMVSHDVEFCAAHADIVSMMFDGSIVTTNTPNRFFSRNSFYTTAANRMSRHIFDNAVNTEDVIELCMENLDGK
ncbi:MAG: ATP-binding cassette domain-containing protein [Firmicutes bacterium]|nr:ATP-binding cassette domain-containing protein [Bacillota bacterium]